MQDTQFSVTIEVMLNDIFQKKNKHGNNCIYFVILKLGTKSKFHSSVSSPFDRLFESNSSGIHQIKIK